MPFKFNPTTGKLDLVNSSTSGGVTDHGLLTGLSDDDHTELKRNAMSLLLYGVEGTLAGRHDYDAEERAKKAAGVAAPGGST